MTNLYLSPPLDKKSRIRETKNLSTDADSRTDTIFERLSDLSIFLKRLCAFLKKKEGGRGGRVGEVDQ